MTTDMRARVSIAAASFERRWTMNALKRVDPELHEAIEDQQRMLHSAYFDGTEEGIKKHGEAMCRGWLAAAERMEQENEPDDSYLLCVDIPTGTKVAISEYLAATSRVQELHGEDVVVLAPHEVAAMFVGGQAIAQVKSFWPEAKVVGSCPKIDRYPDEPAQEDA